MLKPTRRLYLMQLNQLTLQSRQHLHPHMSMTPDWRLCRIGLLQRQPLMRNAKLWQNIYRLAATLSPCHNLKSLWCHHLILNSLSNEPWLTFSTYMVEIRLHMQIGNLVEKTLMTSEKARAVCDALRTWFYIYGALE